MESLILSKVCRGPEPTLEFTFGRDEGNFTIRVLEDKTFLKRMKWKLWSFLFPIRHKWLE